MLRVLAHVCCVSLQLALGAASAQSTVSAANQPQRLAAPQARSAVDALPKPAVVAEVLLAVGAMRREPAGEPLKRGAQVFEGDQIHTQDGAHLHLRFVDGAMVSVRPNSRLQIEQYRWDPQNAGRNQVKFRLDEGVARSITGQAGETSKDRFRLNTPVAAVGVRGTDFVVQTGLNDSAVLVNRGAVVIAPFDTLCRADALGPCASPASRELRAEMGEWMAKVEAGRVQMMSAKEWPAGRRPHPSEPRSLAFEGAGRESNGSAGVDTAQVATPGVLTAGNVSIGLINAWRNDAAAAARDPAGERLAEERAEHIARAYTKVVNPGASLPASVLTWGRWAQTPIANEQNPAPWIERSDYANMLVSDGVNAIFGPAGTRDIVPNNGRFAFVLRDARAALLTDQGPSAGKIQGGSLGIDFAIGRFETVLRGSHQDVDGTIVISGSGPMRNDGLFRALMAQPADPNIVGVVANEGKEAVYVFSKPVLTRSGQSSSFFGLSRWGR